MPLMYQKNDAWVMSPYCFCADRPWLFINELNLKSTKENADADEDILPIPGLSTEDTALMAALLTTVAIFILLLFLLVCLFTPFGLCCKKRSACCSRTQETKTSEMKIPRVWTDNDIGYWRSNYGFSDSELGKGRQCWNVAARERSIESGGQRGLVINAFRGDDVKNGGWLSARCMAHNYSGGDSSLNATTGWESGKEGSHGEMIELDRFYGGSAKGLSIPLSQGRSSKSYRNIIEELMTPHITTTDFSTHSNSAAIGSHDNNMVVREAVSNSYVYSGRRDLKNVDQTSNTLTKLEIMNVSDGSGTIFKRDITDAVMDFAKETLQKEISGRTGNMKYVPASSYRIRGHNSEFQPDATNHVTTNSLTTATDVDDVAAETDVRRTTINPSHDLITERTTTYVKKVTEETVTVN